MFINHQREKLLNAVVFFCRNTKHCHTLKLFKLLYFLDFEHFRQTGRSVTGLNYKAFQRGPVPTELWDDLKRPPSDLSKVVAVIQVRDEASLELLRRDIKPRGKFDGAHFSKREMQMMGILADFFKESRADDMSEVTHMRGLPWRKVFADGVGKGRDIPYEMALESEPLIHDAVSIEPAEFKYRQAAFDEIDRVSGGKV